MTRVHKVFISFHHDYDQQYYDQLRNIGQYIFVDRSVDIGDIDPHDKTDTIRRKIRDDFIRDASVVIVLIGKKTWSRKHVDWEISSGIRATQYNPRCGLIGLFLPTHPDYGRDKYDPHIIPPRLHFNNKCNYAELYNWTTNTVSLQEYIHQAFLRKDQVDPDNSYPLFKNNRSGDRWS